MLYAPVIIFVVTPLVLGWWIQLRFWKFATFRRLKEKAKEFDAAKIPLRDYPPEGLPLSKLRKTNDLGDKTVVAHHLVATAGELADTIREELCIGTLFVAMVTLFQYVTRPASQQPQASSWLEWLAQGAKYLAEFWQIPTGELLVVLFACHSGMVLSRQIKKYREVLDLE